MIVAAAQESVGTVTKTPVPLIGIIYSRPYPYW